MPRLKENKEGINIYRVDQCVLMQLLLVVDDRK